MKLAFKKASAGGIWDKFIGFWTRSPFCHVEIAFDELAVMPQLLTKPLGTRTPASTLCFSSDSSDKGTRFRWIELTPNTWDLIPVPEKAAGKDSEAAILAQDFAGLEYNWVDVLLGFSILPGADDRDARQCSEICYEILVDLGCPWPKRPWRISPGGLYKLVTKGLT